MEMPSSVVLSQVSAWPGTYLGSPGGLQKAASVRDSGALGTLAQEDIGLHHGPCKKN